MARYSDNQISESAQLVVDGENVFHSRLRIGQIDAGRLRGWVRTTFGPGVAQWHQCHTEGRTRFFDCLRRLGYQIYSPAPRHCGDRADYNLDVAIAVEAMKNLARYRTLVLVTGDGDFAPLLAAAREVGVRRVVIAERSTVSPLLIEQLDDIDTDLVDLAEFASATIGAAA